jgi:hypothetical protein
MSRIATLVAALIVGFIAIGMVVIGRNLVMPLAAAEEKGVGAGPWFLVWGMIAVLVLSSVVLIGFLVSSLKSSARR